MNPTKTKLTFYDDPEFEKVFSGIEKLYKAVSMTLGPRSRAVLVDEIYRHFINKDGVTVAKSIVLKDPVENAAANVMKESAQKTVDEVGDGTTVTIILAHALIKECRKVIATGTNPMALRKGLEEGVEQLTKELDKLATPVKTLQEKINIATISASGDQELGRLIASTLEEIGVDGVLTVEESKDLETKVEKQEGMQLENGYSHPLFINSPDRMAAIYDNVPVLVTTRPIHNLQEFGPFLEMAAKRTKQLVIIAPDVSTDIMEVLLQNKLNGNFFTLVVKAPSVGDNQREILRDICALTAAKCISYEAGDKFEQVVFEDLGTLEKIISNKYSTVLVGRNDTKPQVKERVTMIKAQMDDEELSEWEHEKLKERLGKLTNGIAIIRVGGATEIEMKERKERALDAVSATQAAIKEGVVAGGETALLGLVSHTDDPILKQALLAPFNKLMTNAGADAGEMRAKLDSWRGVKGAKNFGIDVTDLTGKDMITAGILDPVAVPKAALKNALSVAIQLLTLGCVITVIPEVKK